MAKKKRKLLGTKPGPIGVASYAEPAKVIEETGPEFVTDVYRPFFGTDARTVMVKMAPNHWNFFPNPALRVDGSGWDALGFDAGTPVHTGTATGVGTANVAMINGFPASNGQTARITFNGTVTTLMRQTGATLVQKDVPFPLSAPVSSWRLWDAAADSLDAESWVGNAILVSGEGTLRYRDNGHFVYVGPEDDLPQQVEEWYEPGWSSPEWRFSSYFKGRGEVRLSMRAYASTNPSVAGSPPVYHNAVRLTGSPDTWPYGHPAVITEVQGLEGPEEVAWDPKEGPFYTSLGVVPTADTNPTTMTSMGLLAATLEQSPGDMSVWEIKTSWQAVTPYYTRWGIPDLVESPADETDVSRKYVRRTADGSLWIARSGAYVLASVKQHQNPAAAVPDYQSMPPLLMWNNAVYRAVTPVPTTQTGLYVLDGTPTAVSGTGAQNPLEMPPGAKYLIEPDKEVWQVLPPPYYVSSGDAPYFAEVSSQWMPVGQADDWVRWSVRTGYKQGTSATTAVSFAGVGWIDAVIHVRNATDLRMSAFLLDPCEFPFAEYFDGDMEESPGLDDYFWNGTPNDSISWYFYQRKQRFEWLHRNLFYVVPVGRPYQLFQGSYRHPYIPTSPPMWEVQ